MNFCRVCEASGNLSDMAGYLPAFESITGIEVQSGAFLCRTCTQNLEIAVNFRKQALATDLKLRELTVVKEEPSENCNETQIIQTKDCPYCFQSFDTRKSGSAHIKAHIVANGGLECDYCNKLYSTKRILKLHILNIHVRTKERIIKCPDCDREFKSPHNFRDHQRIVHFKGEQIQFVCPEPTCKRPFNRKHTMMTHIQMVHDKIKREMCGICQKWFADTTRLKAHMLVHNGIKRYVCQICSKAFAQKGNLIQHEMSHRDTADFPCDVCGKCFKYQGLVNMHRVIHFDTFKYECEICGQKFRTRSNFITHHRIHESIAIPCEMCGKIFKSNQSLKNHVRLHTGQLFECDECPGKFQSKHDLKKHVESAHRGFRYTCGICARGYTKQTSLTRHMKSGNCKSPNFS